MYQLLLSFVRPPPRFLRARVAHASPFAPGPQQLNSQYHSYDPQQRRPPSLQAARIPGCQASSVLRQLPRRGAPFLKGPRPCPILIPKVGLHPLSFLRDAASVSRDVISVSWSVSRLWRKKFLGGKSRHWRRYKRVLCPRILTISLFLLLSDCLSSQSSLNLGPHYCAISSLNQSGFGICWQWMVMLFGYSIVEKESKEQRWSENHFIKVKKLWSSSGNRRIITQIWAQETEHSLPKWNY